MVREEREPIDPELFNLRYVSAKRPVIMRGAIKDDPVIQAWGEDADLKKK